MINSGPNDKQRCPKSIYFELKVTVSALKMAVPLTSDFNSVHHFFWLKSFMIRIILLSNLDSFKVKKNFEKNI